MKELSTLIDSLMAIRSQILEGEKEHRTTIENVHPKFRYSAKNFIRYLKLRTFDLREIQAQLSSLGLSSISHSERHVLANVENILHFLHLNQGQKFNGCHALGQHPVNFAESQKVLQENTQRLLKTLKNPDSTSIMVTLSSTAIEYQHVKDLVKAGMKVARI